MLLKCCFFFAWFKFLPAFPHFGLCGNRRQNRSRHQGTLKFTFGQPLCSFPLCFFMHMSFYHGSQDTKTKAEQENVFFHSFPFPERQKVPVTLSEVKQQPFPCSSSNEPICLSVEMTLRFNEERCLMNFSIF